MPCGKIIYNSRSEASDAVRNSYKRGKSGGKGEKWSKLKLHSTYFCNVCNGWHTSSNAKSKGKHGNKVLHTKSRRKPSQGRLNIINYNKYNGDD